MRKPIWLLLAATAVSSLALALPSSASDSHVSHNIAAHITAGDKKMKANDIAGARVEYEAAAADPALDQMPFAERHALLSVLALTEAATNDYQAAYDHLSQAGPALSDNSDFAYYSAMVSAADATGHGDQAVEAFGWMADTHPKVTAHYALGAVYDISALAAKKNDGGATQRRLLESLWGDHYTSPDIFDPMDELWFDLFADEVAAGNDAKAREIMATFTAPEIAVRLRSDKRYARFVAADPAHADLSAMTEASIARARSLMNAHPDSIEAVQSVVSYLLNANRLDEALKLADDTLAKVAAAGSKPAYTDQAEKLHWLEMSRSVAMRRFGHGEDETKALENARDNALANSYDKVSQAINLGDRYIVLGRSQDALDAVKDVDGHVSPYGMMSGMAVRACAYSQLGDKARLADAMTYLKAHADDGFGPYTDALACADDDAGLAAFLIARLDNPMTRNLTLYKLQDFLTSPTTPIQQTWRAVWKKTLERDDVKAAVDKYGSIDSYPIYDPLDG